MFHHPAWAVGSSPNLIQPNPGSPPDGSPCSGLCYAVLACRKFETYSRTVEGIGQQTNLEPSVTLERGAKKGMMKAAGAVERSDDGKGRALKSATPLLKTAADPYSLGVPKVKQPTEGRRAQRVSK